MHSRPESSKVAWSPYSVAICTYNGERHLAAQLTSILDARNRCEELVLVDDASTDGTLAIVSRAISGAPGTRLVIEVNPVNIGSRRSFDRALRLTTRPLVFLADQDDVWHPAKTDRMLAEFARRPDLLLLHSDARVVDHRLQSYGYTLMQAIEATRAEKEAIHRGDAFDAFIRRNIATGATIAMRRTLLDYALPIPDGWVHDEWLATIASAIGRVDFIDDPLVDYRQHGGNQIGARRLSLRAKVVKAFAKPGDYYAKQLLRTATLLAKLTALGPLVPPDRLVKTREKLNHLRTRAALPRNRLVRIFPIAGQVLTGGYRRYSTGSKSLVRDLFHRS